MVCRQLRIKKLLEIDCVGNKNTANIIICNIFQIKHMMAVPPLCEELVALEEWLDLAEQQLFAR